MYFSALHSHFKSGSGLILMIMNHVSSMKNRRTGNINRFIRHIKEYFFDDSISFDQYIPPVISVKARTWFSGRIIKRDALVTSITLYYP